MRSQYKRVAHLEILNIVVPLKVWAKHWANKRIKVHCDNMAVVEVLRNGRARDTIFALLARNIWLSCAIFNIHIMVLHIPGRNNTLADFLDGSFHLQTITICSICCHILY